MKNMLSNLLPINSTAKQIGIIGGAFDPPHLGHELLALSVLSTTYVEEIWVIPGYAHPTKQPVANFSQRLQMCKLAFSPLANVVVLDVEKYLQTPSYTVNTIKALQKTAVDKEFTLIIGSDLLGDIAAWHRGDYLLENAKFLVIDRQGFTVNKKIQQSSNIVFHHGFSIPDIKSHEFRNSSKSDANNTINKNVLAYIKMNKLYKLMI